MRVGGFTQRELAASTLPFLAYHVLVFRTEDSKDREDFFRTFLETTSQQQQAPVS